MKLIIDHQQFILKEEISISISEVFEYPGYVNKPFVFFLSMSRVYFFTLHQMTNVHLLS